MTRLRIFASGRVQGVWYRRSAQAKARKLGVTGWARNLIDGRVEMLCEGEEKNTQEFLTWAKKGPFFAKVKNVKVQEERHRGEFEDFYIRESGF
ncbi:MAG: acylphosphatase [Parcubacteria group bacterium]|nr:acylphosphatase [Parcubacteria group bacterium]